MHPRVVVYAITGLLVDLMSLLAAATLLLTNNPWIHHVGPMRLLFVACVVAIGLVPILYGRERMIVTDLIERLPRRKAPEKPAWDQVDSSVRVA